MNRHTVVTFVPRMDEFDLTLYENEQIALLPMAARNIEQAMADVELEIKRTLSIDEAVEACLTLAAFAERFHQLERLALARAEALNTTQRVAS